MSPSTIEKFEGLLTARDIDDLTRQGTKLIQSLGFEHFVYGVRLETSGGERDFVINGYPDPWRTKYVEQNYHLLDPTVAHCMRSVLPLIWNERHFASTEQRAFLEEARSNGLHSGLSIPVHGGSRETGMLSLAVDTPASKQEQRRIELALSESMLLSTFLHEGVKRLLLQAQPRDDVPALTARELECLRWASRGKTSWETGQIINCTERTVNFHIGNVVRKLGASNRRQAVVKAISIGLIDGY